MTSSPERREREYEDVSWWDFINGEAFEEPMRTHLDSVPQLLVAMTAKNCDARSFGNVTTQLAMDQVQPTGHTDSLLNGPTSVAWFQHWRRYLENQGVRFHRGRLERFEQWGRHLWPVATVWDGDENPRRRVIVRDFNVIAISAQAIQDILRNQPSLRGGDFDKIREFSLEDFGRPAPTGALQHMVGIQYYLPAEFKMVAGHSEYPDAPWRLSSVFQSQFWLRKRGWWDGYRGVLSVVMCRWDVPASEGGPIAWDLPPEEVAHRVWEQVTATIPPEQAHRIPMPILFHFDENMSWDEDDGYHNLSPLLINRPREFRERPGRLHDEEGYSTHEAWRIVFAGTLMKTHTRLTTMEAANESARHAVNGILHADDFRGDRCAIFDPEKNELDDLRIFVDLDRALVDQHLPHFVDILGLEEFPEFLLRFDASGPHAFDALVDIVRTAHQQFERLARTTVGDGGPDGDR
jgi:hypothetical protein